jgi:hypothetical protein
MFMVDGSSHAWDSATSTSGRPMPAAGPSTSLRQFGWASEF